MIRTFIYLAFLLVTTSLSMAEEGDYSIINYGPDFSVIQYEDADGIRANVAAVRSRKGIVVINSFVAPAPTAVAHNMIRDRFDAEILYHFITNPTIERNGGNQVFKRYTIIAHHKAGDVLKRVFAGVELDIMKKRTALENVNNEIQKRSGEESPEIEELKRRKGQLEHFLDTARQYNLTLPESKVFSDNSIDLFDKTIQIRDLGSAITIADLVVFIPEIKTIVCGDMVVEGLLPLWDAEKGGSLRGLLQATEKLLGYEGEYERIIPGFGTPGGFEIVRNQRTFLLDLMSAVNTAKAEGRNPEDVFSNLKDKYATDKLSENDLASAINQAWEELN